MALDIEKLERIVRGELHERGCAHDYPHAKRVLRNARAIASTCGSVDTRLLTAMCLLHDIVRPEGEGEKESATLSAERSVVLLRQCGFEEESIIMVMKGIRSHSLVSRGGRISRMLTEPASIEERILFDADKLDALGPIGVARWFASTSTRRWDLGRSAREYVRIINDFKKLRGGLYTPAGNRLAFKKMQYSLKYMQNLLKHLREG